MSNPNDDSPAGKTLMPSPAGYRLRAHQQRAKERVTRIHLLLNCTRNQQAKKHKKLQAMCAAFLLILCKLLPGGHSLYI